jgi:hypothetical protein
MNATILERGMHRASIIGMGTIKWKLAEFLEANKLTAYRLATTLDSHTRTPTIYRIAKKDVELSRVDFTVLATVIEGLRELTGKDVGVSDLLEYHEEA